MQRVSTMFGPCTFLHLLLVLSSMAGSGGTAPPTEGARKSSDLWPRAKAALTSASMEGKNRGPSDWLPVFNHLTGRQVDVASKKRRRSVPQVASNSNKSSAKPKTVKSKQRKTPDGRRRRVNFPMDRIGHMYLPNTRN
ncbi:osteocrin [Mustelus asterias]